MAVPSAISRMARQRRASPKEVEGQRRYLQELIVFFRS